MIMGCVLNSGWTRSLESASRLNHENSKLWSALLVPCQMKEAKAALAPRVILVILTFLATVSITDQYWKVANFGRTSEKGCYSRVLGCFIVVGFRSLHVWDLTSRSLHVCLRHVWGPFSMYFESYERRKKWVGDLENVFSKIIFLCSRFPRKVPGKFLRSEDILENEQILKKPKMSTKFWHF